MNLIKKGDKAALVCCSNGQDKSAEDTVRRLCEKLQEIGLIPVPGDFIYKKEYGRSGTARERADSLMNFYRNDEIKVIFDISGGDLANEILPYLEFDEIAGKDKLFFGYSDLTTIINAIYVKTNRQSVLYQIRNLVYQYSGRQMIDFCDSMMGESDKLFDFSYHFHQGQEMKGIIVGGNIRCLLKLAGTTYFPDCKGKILFLEAFSGSASRIITYLSQLEQIGAFSEISGVLLGTFTELCGEGEEPVLAAELVRDCIGTNIPIAYTKEIGHGPDSKALCIGQYYHLKNRGRI